MPLLRLPLHGGLSLLRRAPARLGPLLREGGGATLNKPGQSAHLSATGGPRPLAAVQQASDPSPFEGRSFACTECGKCCSGPGEVWVNDDDCRRLSDHLGVSLKDFQFRYTDRKPGGRPGFRGLKNLPGGSQDCVFLLGGLLCSVHEARPIQCSTYPYWPDLEDQDDWDEEREVTCEGMDHPEASKIDPEVAKEQSKIYKEHFGIITEEGGLLGKLWPPSFRK